MTVNIVSRNATLCRLLQLELSRFGLIPAISETPLRSCELCVIDAFSCHEALLSEQTVLFLLGKLPEHKLTSRARVVLPLPLFLPDLRSAITEYLIGKSAPMEEKPPQAHSQKEQNNNQLVIHRETRSATVGNSAPIPLSEIEYKLLCRLEEFGSSPLSHQDVKDILGEATSNKLNVYICFLRRKLEQGDLRLIHTVRGKGYTLHPQERKQL